MKNNYKWEIELSDGTIVDDGDNFTPSEVRRVSFIPTRLLLPRHDLIFLKADFKPLKTYNSKAIIK